MMRLWHREDQEACYETCGNAEKERGMVQE